MGWTNVSTYGRNALIEGSLEVKLPTISTNEKQRWEEPEKRREEKKKEETVKRKKIQVREKVGKSRNTVFFQWFVAPEGRKVGSLKRRVRSNLARARSTFGSENAKSNSRSEHFWKLRCWKSAPRCGAKHISKSKCTNYTMFGPLLKIEMSKKCTRLWREAHFQVKMYNVHHARPTFGSWHVGKVHAIVARSTFRSQKCKKLKGFGALLDVRMSFCVAGTGGSAPCQKRAKRIGFVSVSTTTAAALHSTPLRELHYTPLGSTTPHYTNYNYNYNYITLH